MEAENLTELVESITKESESLKGHGQLDGLHNIARQNSYLAQLYKELILSIKSLHKWTIRLTWVLIVLTIALIVISVIPYLGPIINVTTHIR